MTGGVLYFRWSSPHLHRTPQDGSAKPHGPHHLGDAGAQARLKCQETAYLRPYAYLNVDLTRPGIDNFPCLTIVHGISSRFITTGWPALRVNYVDASRSNERRPTHSSPVYQLNEHRL